MIKSVLERCAVPLLEDSSDPLVIESVHCLTKDPEPRTKCWRVVVPPKFKAIMENSMLYPEGWDSGSLLVFSETPQNQPRR